MKRLLLATVLLCAGAHAAEAACLPGAIPVAAGQSIQAAVNAAPVGAAFCLGAGHHREQSVIPKNNQRFTGDGTAQMLGSKRVSAWTQEGAFWFASGQTQTPPTTNIAECAPGFPMCNVALAVFHGTASEGFVPLYQVSNKAAMNADSFWWDAANSRIYIGRSPVGKIVEITTTESAFSGSATGVVVEDIIVRWYAPRLQRAAIHGADGTSWTIDNVRVLSNYAVGVDVGSNSTVRGSVISGNGEMGLACGGTGILIENNKITYNGHWAGLDPAWEGGGFKCTEVHGGFVTVNGKVNGTGLTVSGNTISGNRSVGAWLDEGTSTSLPNSGVVIRNNTIDNNDSVGISIEISHGPVLIIDNVIRGNGVTSGWFWGGCLQAYDSANVEAYGNTCDVSATHGNGMMVISQGGRIANSASGCGNNFHDNTIILRRAGATTGATGDNLASFCGANVNRYDHNSYFVPGTAPHWAWQDDEMGWAAFRSISGQEANGTVTVGAP